MELHRVKYTKSGKPYVELKVKSGAKKGYVVRRYGKISACDACQKKYFARNEQLKKGIGKFCSVACAKVFERQKRRRKELAHRRSEQIKSQTVYFRDDGKIYVEKKDAKGKLYRYYGKLRDCLVCSEKFFADFAQIRLDKAKYCSPPCAQQGIGEPPQEEAIPLPQEPLPQQQETLPQQQGLPPQQEKVLPKKQAEKITIGLIGLPQREHTSPEREMPRRRPVGTKICAVLFMYIAFYYLIIGLRMYGGPLEKPKKLLLAVANIVLAYAFLTIKSWMRSFLVIYLIFIAATTAATYYIALYVEPLLKGTVLSQTFLIELLVAFVPHIIALFYVRQIASTPENVGR
jgi:hypothetical protein